MINHFHLLSSLDLDVNGYRLFCRCSREHFENLVDIVCEGEDPFICKFEVLKQDAEEVRYRVDLPATLPSENHYFTAVSRTGEKKAVWRPDYSLAPESLPPGFFFQHTHLNLTYHHGQTIAKLACYPTNCHAVFTGISRKQSALIFTGFLFLPLHATCLDDINLHIIRFRDEKVCSLHSVELASITEKIFALYDPQHFERYSGNNVFKIRCTIDMERIMEVDGYYSILLVHNRFHFTPKNYFKTLSEKDYCFPLRLSLWKRALIVPYCNEFINSWRMDIYHLNILEWQRLRLKKLCSQCTKKLFSQSTTTLVQKNSKIWLLGEYGTTARDNGMHFYNFLCQKKKKDITAYFVIYRNSKQRCNLLPKNIIFFGSYKHFKIAAQAGVLIFTHLPELLVPKIDSIISYRNKLSSFKKIFIQHGVIATTAIALIYKKKVRQNDKFVVSSSFEKDIIRNHLGYNDEEVIVTGLARWDNLLATSKQSTDILIIPTWRNNLDNVSKEVFKQSNYYTFWNTLLSNAALLKLIREKNIAVNFFLHIGIERFADCFEVPPEIQQANDINIQKLLSTCGLMITDYSSVAFDVLLQNKPVIFCPFDYDEMMELRKGPKFINFEKELPGPICYDLDTTINEIIKHVTGGYRINELYRNRRKKFFDHIDNHNCERTFQEITRYLNNC